MRFKFLSLLLSTLFSLAVCSAGEAVNLDILAKARAYIGPSEKLDAVTSIHYRGTLTAPDGKKLAIDIVFQKPYQQRIAATGADSIEITALDGYDGWQRFQDAKDPGRWRQTLLNPDQIKRLRANTIESLGFYSGPGDFGSVTDLGMATVEGKNLRKISFRHAKDIIFHRFFDPVTGKLVRTETEQGGLIVEQGEIYAEGLRFPKQIVTTTKTPDGKQQSITIDIDMVEVNKAFAASLFAVPSISTGAAR